MDELERITGLVNDALEISYTLRFDEPHSPELPDPISELKITQLLLKQAAVRLEIMRDRLLVG